METIAVYRESRIRTYGFCVREGLLLGRLTFAGGPSALTADTLAVMGQGDGSFQWVWAQPAHGSGIEIFLLCSADRQADVEQLICQVLGQSTLAAEEALSLVDLLYFQGPHFGDRYGIADFTLRALTQVQVPLIAVTCSGSVIGLVVPAGWGCKTESILSREFEIPMGQRSRPTGQDPACPGTNP